MSSPHPLPFAAPCGPQSQPQPIAAPPSTPASAPEKRTPSVAEVLGAPVTPLAAQAKPGAKAEIAESVAYAKASAERKRATTVAEKTGGEPVVEAQVDATGETTAPKRKRAPRAKPAADKQA